MNEPIDPDILKIGIQKAQERLAEIDNGTVQAIPGNIALAQIRQPFGTTVEELIEEVNRG